jgi:uncharacterized YigZ family protein
MPEYNRPKASYRTEIEILKSRFIATVFPVCTVEEAKSRLVDTRREMTTANHHVYAFIVGFGSSVIEGLSDDGEPTGTAGQPVMAVLRGSQLGDTLIVVTRYFGGTLLGTGGLVRAYTEAAQAALARVEVERKVERRQVMLVIPYSAYQRISRLLREHEVIMLEEEFGSEVTLLIEISNASIDIIERAVADTCAGKAEFVRY